jgi:hypothetical protein
MIYRTSGEGYEYVAEDKSSTPAYIHRLVAVAEHGFEAVTDDMDVHHEMSVPWYNSAENLEIEGWREHRVAHLENGRNIPGDD